MRWILAFMLGTCLICLPSDDGDAQFAIFQVHGQVSGDQLVTGAIDPLTAGDGDPLVTQ